MNRILSILLVFLLMACSAKQERVDEVFYVIRQPIKETLKNKKTPSPPPPPKSYYGNLNFILFDSSTVLFHSRKVKIMMCGNGINEIKPPRIFLTPNKLTKINVNDLPKFLLTTVKDSLASENYIFSTISSPTDTIRNKAFKIISDFLKTKNKRPYIIRNWTEEEKFVSLAKINNKKYNPDSINWKIGFEH